MVHLIINVFKWLNFEVIWRHNNNNNNNNYNSSNNSYCINWYAVWCNPIVLIGMQYGVTPLY